MNDVMLEFGHRKFGGMYVCTCVLPKLSSFICSCFFFFWSQNEIEIEMLVLKNEKCCVVSDMTI